MDLAHITMTPQNRVDAFFAKAQNIIRDKILEQLNYLGVEAVNKVRDRSKEESWYDQTGNLRSSIGYAIYEDGKKLMQSAFETVGKGTAGSAAGRAYVDQLAAKFANTYALCVVAAMDYAEYVEAKENKDVLASTELYVRAEIEQRLKDANENAIARINQLVI